MSRLMQGLNFTMFFVLFNTADARFFDDYDDVILEVTEIRAYDEYDSVYTTTFEEPIELSLTGFNSDFFVQIIDFDPGVYEKLVFVTKANRETFDSVVVFDDAVASVYVTNNQLTFDGPFLVAEDGNFDFTFDLEGVIYQPEDAYSDFKLAPQIPIVDFNQN